MKRITIVTLVLVFLMTASILVIRYQYRDHSRIDGMEISISGLVSGNAVDCSGIISGISMSVPYGYTADDLVSVSSNPEVGFLRIFKGSDDNARIARAEIEAKSPGIVELYVKTVDGKVESKHYKINVTSDGGDGVITTKQDTAYDPGETDSETVYVTPSGKKYHLKESCAGKNAIPTDLEDAVNDGYGPCKLCAYSK